MKLFGWKFRIREVVVYLSVGLLSLVFSIIILSGLYANEAPELAGDRPDVTESALTVPGGSVQLESGYTFTRSGAFDTHSVGEALFRIGAFDFLELRAGFNSWLITETREDTVRGMEDFYGGIKIQLLRAGDIPEFFRPDIALIAGALFPTGDEEYRGESWEPICVLSVAWALGGPFSLGINTGVSFPEEGGSRYNHFSFSSAFAAELTQRMGIYGEYFMERSDNENSETEHYIDGGMTFLIMEGLQLDARIGRKLNGDQREYFAGAGFVARGLDIF